MRCAVSSRGHSHLKSDTHGASFLQEGLQSGRPAQNGSRVRKAECRGGATADAGWKTASVLQGGVQLRALDPVVDRRG